MPHTASSDFDSVALDSSVLHDCSPVLDESDINAKGIKINSPGVININIDEDENIVDPSTRFPVCIAMQYPLKDMIKYDYPRALITLVIVNKLTGDSFSENLAYARPREPKPKMDLPKNIIETRIQRYYYNVNLCNYLRLPAVRGTYFLYATFKEYKSNTMTVELK